MKRRLMALALAVILCLSLSVNVFAEQATGVGTSSGGSSGTLRVTTKLYVTKYMAEAFTNCTGNVSAEYFATTVRFYYTNSLGHEAIETGNGSVAASDGDSAGTGKYATSTHSIYGGSDFGTWTGSLRANAS